MIHLQTIWKIFYSKTSANDKGTLFQLKELIHRTSVVNDPKHRTKSSEDFLLTVLHAHIIAAAKVCCEEQDTEDSLVCAKKIVQKFVNVKLSSQDSTIKSNDMSYNYATNLLTLGLVWHGYHDAIKEGDGNRILQYYKFLIPIFYQEKHYNYAREGFQLLVQSNILSERKLMELKWCRTVNTLGRKGCNIPIDLFMEHMNRRLKYMIGSLQSNVKPSTIQRVAKSLDVVKHVCHIFQRQSEVTENKGYASYPTFEDDCNKIVKQLEDESVFVFQQSGRSLETFDSQPLLSNIKWENIISWLKENISNIDMYN